MDGTRFSFSSILALSVLHPTAEKCDQGKPPKQLFKSRLLSLLSFRSWGLTPGLFECLVGTTSQAAATFHRSHMLHLDIPPELRVPLVASEIS